MFLYKPVVGSTKQWGTWAERHLMVERGGCLRFAASDTWIQILKGLVFLSVVSYLQILGSDFGIGILQLLVELQDSKTITLKTLTHCSNFIHRLGVA